MTDHLARLYAFTLAILVFVIAWAGVAARPWAEPGVDPRVEALAARERRLEQQSVRIKQLVDRRYAAYSRALAARQKSNALAAAAAARTPAPAPSVRIVTLPPLTATRSS